MIQLTIRLSDREAAALAEMARRFQFNDAQHLLRQSRNITADVLCESVTRLHEALRTAGVSRGQTATIAPFEPAGGNPMVTGKTRTSVSIALTIDRAELVKHREFLETLLAAASPRRS
jgi:hypothetical protein